ncbi:peptidoglycan-binding domain-containing protein, partial [Myceligenerans salitolerans]
TESDEGAYSTSFWDGAGALTDDFGDHDDELGGDLCNGCANSWNTGTVRAWQAILFAERLLPKSGIDGQFGPNTHDATVQYQKNHGLGVDGRVGPETWGYADDRLRWLSYERKVVYSGVEGTVTFERGNSDHGNPGGSGAYRLIQSCTWGDCKTFGSTRIYH